MKTVNKALDILEMFLKNDEQLGVFELARLTGIHVSTVNRICSTLTKRGYLNQSGERGKYYLGMKYYEFTNAIKHRTNLRDIAMPFLVKLNQQVNETVSLASLDGTKCILLAVVPANHLLKIDPPEGSTVPLYNSGLGKAILASFTDEQLKEFRKKVAFHRYTQQSIINMKDLKNNLAIIRQEGIAYDNEENIVGLRNVAAAVRDHKGITVAAIGAVGPSSRLPRTRMKEIAPLVKKCADEVSKRIW